jgi:hypothetical protein
MSSTADRAFDCVQHMRHVRDRMSTEIVSMSYEELAHWAHSHRFSDPLFQRLADRTAQQPHAAAAASGRR